MQFMSTTGTLKKTIKTSPFLEDSMNRRVMHQLAHGAHAQEITNCYSISKVRACNAALPSTSVICQTVQMQSCTTINLKFF